MYGGSMWLPEGENAGHTIDARGMSELGFGIDTRLMAEVEKLYTQDAIGGVALRAEMEAA